MSFDEYARHAATALRETAFQETDVGAMRAALDRTRARRRAQSIVAAAGASIAAVTLAVALARPAGPTSPLPATPPAASTSTSVAAPAPRLEELVTGEGIGAVTNGAAPAGSLVQAIAFSPNGDRVAYSDRENDTGSTWVTSAGLAAPRLIAGDSWDIAWTPDGLQLILVGPDGVRVHSLATSTTRTLPLPQDWKVSSVDVNADGLLALQGSDQDYTHSMIMTVELTGANPRVVLTDPTTLYFARWSPDGRTIAFMRRDVPPHPASSTVAAVTVESVDAEGTGRRVLARAGTAAFVGITPGLDWSPEGRLAYVGGQDAPAAQWDQRDFPGGGGLSIERWASGPLAWRPGSP
jgi:dipeptidyl aminopeptidase/acylaminoacyl peptidase